MKKLILASASPRRRELLEQIGAVFQVCPSQGEEVITGTYPGDVVMELSGQKGQEVFDRIEGDVCVIGADTVVAIDHAILGKPADEQEAIAMLQRLQGRIHEVYTGVTILCRKQGNAQRKSFYEKTTVEFYPVSSEEIHAYVKTGEPLDKAGAYGIQGKSAVFVKRIEGDYNNVVGLPVARVYQEAKEMGIDIKEWHK